MPELADDEVFGPAKELSNEEVFGSTRELGNDEVFGPVSPKESVDHIDSNPFYLPSLSEFDEYRQEKWRQPAEPLKAAGSAISQIWESGKSLVAGLRDYTQRQQAKQKVGQYGLKGRIQDVGNALQTLGEAATRGTVKSGRLARGLLDKVASVTEDESPEQFFSRRMSELTGGLGGLENYETPEEGDIRGARSALNTLPPAPTPESVGPEVRARLDQEYYDYKLKRDYERFMVNRSVDQWLELNRRGQADHLPEVLGHTEQAITEPLSDFVDLTDIATFGAGKIGEGVLRAGTRKAVGAGAKGAGIALEKAGEAAMTAGRIPERAAAAATHAITGSEEAAELARKAVSGGSASLAVAPGVGFTIPGVTEIAQAATGAKTAGAALDAAGEAAQAAGRTMAQGPSRIGLFEQISKDGAAPLWMRKAAANVAVLDPVLKETAGFGGAAVRGAAGGAGIGAGMGFVLSGGDEEAAAGGAGGGLLPGAVGGLYHRVATTRERGATESDADLTHWLAGKSQEELANITRLRLSQEQALKMADVERWARGVINEGGGDIQFHYLSDSDFQKQFGSSQKGAEIVQGETPAVFVNTNYRGPRSMFHEVFHAIDDLTGLEPERLQLNRRLFTETAPDGTRLSKGLFDAKDLADFETSYRDRLGPGARAEWDLMPAEERAQRIRKEVRAESFASMVSGSTGREILTGASGWRRRLTDAVLLADQASSLGRMRQFLEGAGVEFKATGEPSELFFKNGQPVTNAPEVDAALRDYMRAKRRITDRLVAGDDDAPATVFGELAIKSDPQLSRALAEQHPDWDGWKKNSDGSVKIVGGDPDAAAKETAARAALAQSFEADTALARIESERIRAEAQAAAAEERAAQTTAKAQTELDRAQARLETAQARQACNEAKLAQNRAREFKAQVNRVKREAVERRKSADAAAALPGQPVLATEKEIKNLQLRRVEAMLTALNGARDMGEPGIVRDVGNGHWKGQRFSEAQLRALQSLPDDVLSPSMKDRIGQLNQLASEPGRQVILDYNAALKNRRYSSGISPSTRIAVPLSIDISKAGNFVMDTLDVTHFMRKLGAWQTGKPRAFDAWGGDVNGFMRDAFKYLDNHQRGLPGATDLDPDAATAIVKRNVIKDLFNVGGPDALSNTGGAPLSGKGEKDNLIRSRRFDRIQRITPGEGTPFPIDYYKQKANFQPASNFQPTARPAEIIRVTRDQAVADFSKEVGIPYGAAQYLALPVLDRLRLAQPAQIGERGRVAAAAGVLRGIARRDRQMLYQSIMSGGLGSAKDYLNSL